MRFLLGPPWSSEQSLIFPYLSSLFNGQTNGLAKISPQSGKRIVVIYGRSHIFSARMVAFARNLVGGLPHEEAVRPASAGLSEPPPAPPPGGSQASLSCKCNLLKDIRILGDHPAKIRIMDDASARIRQRQRSGFWRTSSP